MRTLLALSALILAGSALAQTGAPEPTKIRYYEFDQYVMHGKVFRADGTLIGVDRRPEFGKLYQLNQRSVLSKLKETAKDTGLR